MKLIVNGQAQELADNLSVEQLVQSRGLTANKVAVELNRRLLRSDAYSTTLKEGDEVEIVTFVGGG